MNSFDFPQTCSICQGYKTVPYTWNSTVAPKMCTCTSPINSLSWECHRCGKINAPWKGSCDCTPIPFGTPTSTTQPYNVGPVPFNHYFSKKDEV